MVGEVEGIDRRACADCRHTRQDRHPSCAQHGWTLLDGRRPADRLEDVVGTAIGHLLHRGNKIRSGTVERHCGAEAFCLGTTSGIEIDGDDRISPGKLQS